MIKLPGNILKSDQRIVTPVSEWSHCKQSKSKYYHINQSRHGHLAHFVHLASFGPPHSSMCGLDTSILELTSSLLVKIQHYEFCSLFLLLFCYDVFIKYDGGGSGCSEHTLGRGVGKGLILIRSVILFFIEINYIELLSLSCHPCRRYKRPLFSISLFQSIIETVFFTILKETIGTLPLQLFVYIFYCILQ